MQSGQLVDIGGVRFVGWGSDDEIKKAFKLRFEGADKEIYMWPQDVVENTIRAWSHSASSATGYSGEAPTGRYFAPAFGPDCISVAEGIGECPDVRRTFVRRIGPALFCSSV